MKIFTALGPGDIVAAHREMMGGSAANSETQIIFSGQLLEYFRVRNIATLALSSNARIDILLDGPLQLENRPRFFEKSSGLRFHCSRIAYAIYLALRAKLFGADLAIIDSGSSHYFSLVAFNLVRIPVVVNFHNVLWPQGFPPKRRLARFILRLNGWWFRRCVHAATGISPECGKQVSELAGRSIPFFEYRSQYRNADFRTGQNRLSDPFIIAYVGRAERSKGLLDIPHIAEELRRRSSKSILFEICGDGPALSSLRQSVAERNLSQQIRIHGRLSRDELFALYARAHAVIVPTRGDFCEGLPAVCAEAVLAGLPVITSALSNAIPVLGPGIVEAQPENIESFAQAILRLTDDAEFYDRTRNECLKLGSQFFDRAQSYPAAVDRLLAYLFPGWTVLQRYDSLYERLR
jgi:glycosyltransferase involved in cell wall biosynthesis